MLNNPPSQGIFQFTFLSTSSSSLTHHNKMDPVPSPPSPSSSPTIQTMSEEERQLHLSFMREALSMVPSPTSRLSKLILTAPLGRARPHHKRNPSRLRLRPQKPYHRPRNERHKRNLQRHTPRGIHRHKRYPVPASPLSFQFRRREGRQEEEV